MIDQDRSEKLRIYTAELLKWNKKINLIGRNTEINIRERHIEDSLRLLPFLEKEMSPYIVDIGSGGGLPAIPLSIYLPEKRFILTDVISKKIDFLEWIIKKLNLNAEVIKADELFQFQNKCVIISRAFSSIKNIINWQEKHAPETSEFYLLKGEINNVKNEIKEADSDIWTDEYAPLLRGCVVVLKKKTPIKPEISCSRLIRQDSRFRYGFLKTHGFSRSVNYISCRFYIILKDR